jgi:hypothetical protein
MLRNQFMNQGLLDLGDIVVELKQLCGLFLA